MSHITPLVSFCKGGAPSARRAYMQPGPRGRPWQTRARSARRTRPQRLPGRSLRTEGGTDHDDNDGERDLHRDVHFHKLCIGGECVESVARVSSTGPMRLPTTRVVGRTRTERCLRKKRRFGHVDYLGVVDESKVVRWNRCDQRNGMVKKAQCHGHYIVTVTFEWSFAHDRHL